jgi:hypothetical protein
VQPNQNHPVVLPSASSPFLAVAGFLPSGKAHMSDSGGGGLPPRARGVVAARRPGPCRSLMRHEGWPWRWHRPSSSSPSPTWPVVRFQRIPAGLLASSDETPVREAALRGKAVAFWVTVSAGIALPWTAAAQLRGPGSDWSPTILRCALAIVSS